MVNHGAEATTNEADKPSVDGLMEVARQYAHAYFNRYANENESEGDEPRFKASLRAYAARLASAAAPAAQPATPLPAEQRYVDGVPQFNHSQPCSVMPGGDPLATQCPRCNNPHHACDRGPATPLREVLSDEQIIEIRKQCFGGRFGAPALEPWGDTIKFARALLAASSDDRKLMQQAKEALENLRAGLIQMRKYAEQYGEAWARAHVKEFQALIPGGAEEQFLLLGAMHTRLADVANGITSSYDAIAALRSRLDGEKT